MRVVEQSDVSTPAAVPSEPLRSTVADLLAALCAEHGLSPMPQLEWSSRMRRALGRAYVDRNMIRLSAWLDEQQAHDTLRHELAHIAVGRRSWSRPHGPNWQAWAARLGVEARATARSGPALAPPPSPRRRVWGLECSACGERFTRVRVSRGLYHIGCGPRNGKLVRVVRGAHAAVAEWLGAGRDSAGNPGAAFRESERSR